jgi:hypothetical protein
MGKILNPFIRDRRGGIGDLGGYAMMSLAIVLSALFASHVAAPYLQQRLAGLGQALAGLGHHQAPAGGFGTGCIGNCAVRVVASPIGYPGLGALAIGGQPAFLVAASPGG